MQRTVGYNDIDQSNPQYVAVSSTPTRILQSRLGESFRNFFSIVPITSGLTVSVILGPVNALANYGTPIITNQPFAQSMDVNGKGIYQGEIWVVASGNGYIAIQETFEQSGLQ